jgi:cytochrome P450
LIQERRADPQDDMISRLTQVEVDRGDGELTKLTDIEIVASSRCSGLRAPKRLPS